MAEMKDVLKELEERMGKTVQYMQDEFATIRAGRANPHVLDRLTVDYYGSATPIQQVGNISVPEARMIGFLSDTLPTFTEILTRSPPLP